MKEKYRVCLILIFETLIWLVYLSFHIKSFNWYVHKPDGWYLIFEYYLPVLIIALGFTLGFLIWKWKGLAFLKGSYLLINFYCFVKLNHPVFELFVMNFVFLVSHLVYFFIIFRKNREGI